MDAPRVLSASRREFLGMAAGGAAAAASSGCCRWCRPAPKQRCCLHVRRRLSHWTEQDFAAYRQAVTVMRARPVSDPTSWEFQANIHGSFSGSHPAWNQCQHGTEHFLTWHRMYLYWWERIVRKASGDPTFAIGYWRYDPNDAASLVLPEPFRAPTSGNALYSPRNAAINGGSPMTASITDSSSDLLEPNLLAPPWPGFSSGIEGTPHGAVHVEIGGLMASVPTAAQDPIFWTHHANIDRLWSRWLDDPAHTNPAGGTFLTTTFEFFDENGQSRKMKGSDVLRTVQQLCYRYDDDPVVRVAGGGTGPGPRPGRRDERRPAAESRVIASTAGERQTLGGEARTIKLDLPAESLEALEGAAGKSQRVVLALEEPSVKGTPDTNYEVYLNLPEGERAPGLKSPHFAGTISFFGLEEDGHKRHGGGTARPIALNVTRTVAGLVEKKLIQGEGLSVTLVPRQPGVEPGQPVKTQAAPSFRRLVLRAE